MLAITFWVAKAPMTPMMASPTLIARAGLDANIDTTDRTAIEVTDDVAWNNLRRML